MNEFLLIGADYLKGKSFYNPLRRGLSLLFNISISSFIYEKIYGNYVWFDFNDYKQILDFFIKGYFSIPLCIFIAVYGITQILSLLIFTSINHFKTIKWTKAIINYQVKSKVLEQKFDDITNTSELVSPIKINKELMINLFTHLKSELSPEAYKQMEKELKEPKNNLEATYHLAFRAILAITIYFISIAHFGWVLYSLTIITLLLGMYLTMLSYRFLDIFPTIVRKFQTEAEKYLIEQRGESKI